MVKPVRIALVVVGLAVAVYGLASLTGGWLGTPPWWERPENDQEWGDRLGLWSGPPPPAVGPVFPVPPHGYVAREGREWTSACITLAGLALAAFGARPRRPRAPHDAG